MRMRIKNFTLLFLMGFFGLFTTNLFAQEDSTIDPSNIRYWIGEGENEVVFIVNWNEPDTALAWGYRFSTDKVLVETIMNDIAEADPRFSYEASDGWLTNIFFNDGVLDLKLHGSYWMYNVNGGFANMFNIQEVVNGDYVKWGDESCGVITDYETYLYIWTKEIAPVYPIAEEARIEASEILYWVGEGSHEVIFAVNWNNPDTCLAWGYRFSEETLMVEDVMNAIAEKDARFAYTGADGWLSDITFDAGNLHLGLSGMYWMYNINGVGAGLGYTQQPVVNGDFIKWGDESCGTEIAPWTLVWETPVTPVTNPTSVAEAMLIRSLYPNPASSYTMLSVENSDDAMTVTVSDLQGRILNSFSVNQHAESIRIETASLNAGIYFVTVSDTHGCQTMKLSVR